MLMRLVVQLHALLRLLAVWETASGMRVSEDKCDEECAS